MCKFRDLTEINFVAPRQKKNEEGRLQTSRAERSITTIERRNNATHEMRIKKEFQEVLD
jgi:guanylate kinase